MMTAKYFRFHLNIHCGFSDNAKQPKASCEDGLAGEREREDITKCKTHSPLINVQSLINEAMRYKEYSNHCTLKVPPASCL